MLPGMELMSCPDMAVPMDVMQHVVRVESSYNPYAIGVVGGRLARQPRNLSEALATARMLESRGYNFSVGLAQVNRYNLARYGLDYSRAFQACPNLQAGSRILAECHSRSGQDWGKSFSCYYSGNFVTGYRHGYVQKIFASMGQDATSPIEVIGAPPRRARPVSPRRAQPALAAYGRIDRNAGSRIERRAEPVTVAVAPAPAAAAPTAAASQQMAGTVPTAALASFTATPAAASAPAVLAAPAVAAPATPVAPRDEAFVF